MPTNRAVEGYLVLEKVMSNLECATNSLTSIEFPYSFQSNPCAFCY